MDVLQEGDVVRWMAGARGSSKCEGVVVRTVQPGEVAALGAEERVVYGVGVKGPGEPCYLVRRRGAEDPGGLIAVCRSAIVSFLVRPRVLVVRLGGVDGSDEDALLPVGVPGEMGMELAKEVVAMAFEEALRPGGAGALDRLLPALRDRGFQLPQWDEMVVGRT